jgi:hypothetical protein
MGVATQQPNRVITIYGIEIDTANMIARLPSYLIQKMSNMLSTFKQERSATLRKLQSLVIIIIKFCQHGLNPRTDQWLNDLIIGHYSPQYRITTLVNADFKTEIWAWHEFIVNFHCKLCFIRCLDIFRYFKIVFCCWRGRWWFCRCAWK